MKRTLDICKGEVVKIEDGKATIKYYQVLFNNNFDVFVENTYNIKSNKLGQYVMLPLWKEDLPQKTRIYL